MSIHLPNVLLSIARYPITAVGLPLALGLYSGLSTSKIVRSLWYQVNTSALSIDSAPQRSRPGLANPTWAASARDLPACLASTLHV